MLQTEASQEENEIRRWRAWHSRRQASPTSQLQPTSSCLQAPEVGAESYPGAQFRIPDSQASVKGCRARQKAVPGGSSFLAKGRTNRDRGQRAVRPPPDSAKVGPAQRGPSLQDGLQGQPPPKEPFWRPGGSACEGFPAQITLLADTERI